MLEDQNIPFKKNPKKRKESASKQNLYFFPLLIAFDLFLMLMLYGLTRVNILLDCNQKEPM